MKQIVLSGWLVVVALGGTLATAAQPVSAGPGLNPPLPQRALATNSPMATFRRLLGMPGGERDAFLASKTDQQRRSIEGKVAEYLALPPEQREARLQALELRWYLMPLLRQHSTNRTEYLRAMPPAYRQIVQQRLMIWDILPPPLQKDVLDNEVAARLVGQLIASGGTETDLYRGVSPEQRTTVEKQLAEFQQLSPERQQHVHNNFRQFFGLDAKEQQRLLAASSPAPDESQVQRTIGMFQNLSPEQRERVVDGFLKFNRLSPAERPAFLKSAERWSALSEKDRELWRQIIARIREAKVMPPPMPPRLGAFSGESPALATNE